MLLLLLSFSLPPTIDIYYGEGFLFFFLVMLSLPSFSVSHTVIFAHLSHIPAAGPTVHGGDRVLPAVCCPPVVVRPRPVAPGRPLMTAFVKATARLFLGSAVNRQIPRPRLEMFSSPCRARTGAKRRGEREREEDMGR